MKVLHVIPAVAARYGGPSRAIFEMCRALQSHGARVLISTTDADGPERLPVEKGRSLDYMGVQTIFFRRQWSEAFGYSYALARWLDDHVADFDVVHIHAVFSHPCLAAARACRRRSVPYIVRPLGTLDPWSMSQKPVRKRFMWGLAVRRMLVEAAAIHYTTPDEKELAESSLGLAGGVVVPLGIETDRLRDRSGQPLFRQKQASLGENPYILAMSRLHPKKNLELLIEAFASVASQPEIKDWKLVVAGDGEASYVEVLKRQVRARGAADKIFFTGWLKGAEKISALQDAALFALPSHQENFGLAVVEALACGVPAIISDRVNLSSSIKESNSGWVTPADLNSLSRVLARAMKDDAERKARGQAGANYVADRFSWGLVASRLALLYKTAAKQNIESPAHPPSQKKSL